MKNKRFFVLIFAVTCVILSLCSCSCHKDDEGVPSTPSSLNTRPDNQNPPETPPVDIECDHLWSDVTVDKNTESTSTAVIKGKCILCTDELSSEVLTWVSYDEWNYALSHDAMKSFTLNNGISYVNYDETDSMSWRVFNNIYTEEYFINSPLKNSAYYVNEHLSGYKMMYGQFTYDNESRAFLYSHENLTVEIMFANKQLLSISTYQNEEHSTKSTTLYLNQGKISVDMPQYFFDRYENMVSVEALSKAQLSLENIQKINELLAFVDFDSHYEVAYAENGDIGIHFYLEEATTDPIFNESYTELSISVKNDRIVSIKIGSNTIDFTY